MGMAGALAALRGFREETQPLEPPAPIAQLYGRPLVPAHGSQPGASRRRDVPVLEQSPHCLRSGAPTRPRRCPRGAESAPGACGVTSAPPGAAALGAGPRTAPCTCLPCRWGFRSRNLPSSPVLLLPTLRPRSRAGRRPDHGGAGQRCRTGRSGSSGAVPSVPQPGCSARAGRGRLRGCSGLVAFHPPRFWGLCRERSGS